MAGEVHCDDRPNSDYDLSLCRLPEGVNVGVDASVMGNHARFVNDFRGIAIKPNALFVDTKTASGELRISIWSSNREIKKGEEILVSYGKTWWRSRAHLAPKVMTF
jgi:SET domain-containing protein